MFNIETTIAALAAAEKVNSSRNLTDSEKLLLLDALSDSLMTTAPGCPAHAFIIAASIQRMTKNERANIANATARSEAEVPNGSPTGIEDTPAVAEEPTEEGPEAQEGQTSRLEEPTEDARSTPDTVRNTKATRASKPSKA